MPTKAASCATAGRILAASASRARSASGTPASIRPAASSTVVVLVIAGIEPGLQDDLRRRLVARGACGPATAAGRCQLGACDLGRMALVDEPDRQAEARFE